MSNPDDVRSPPDESVDDSPSIWKTIQSVVPTAKPGAATAVHPATRTMVLVANLIPALGVLFFGWDAFHVVFLYWSENAILGLAAVVRMALASGGLPGSHFAKVGLIPFFLVHYGIFMFVHGIFVIVLLGGVGQPGVPPWQAIPALGPGFWVAFAALAVEHAYDTYQNYVRNGQFRTAQPAVEMSRPYGRIVVLHLAILGGGFLLVLLGVRGLVILLVIFKTVYELALLRLRSPNAGETYEKVVH
jgi:hypothetical protein